MRTRKQIEADAYERAEEEMCNTDCTNYRRGTCPCDYGNKTKCYLFKGSYDYYVDAIIERECTAAHEVLDCNECYEYHTCPFLYAEDAEKHWTLD